MLTRRESWVLTLHHHASAPPPPRVLVRRRITENVNDYDVKIAHTRGEHVWHVHDDTDEFFLVVDGSFDIALRDGPGGDERTVHLAAGDVFVVPRGTEHRPSSTGGSILMFEPTGTSTTGDRHEGEIPAGVDSTTGHAL